MDGQGGSTTASGIFRAMLAVMTEVGAIGKSKQNVQQGYKFRGIDDVLAVLQPLFVKHGIICTPEVLTEEREMLTTKSGGSMASVRLKVRHTYEAADGTTKVATTYGEAMDSGDKAGNKAMSAALKYSHTMSFSIPTYETDRDTEEASPEMAAKTSPAKAAAKPDDLERAKGLAHARFETSTTEAELEAAWNQLVKPMPPADRAEVAPSFNERRAAIRRATK